MVMVMMMVGVRFGPGSQCFVVIEQGMHAHAE